MTSNSRIEKARMKDEIVYRCLLGIGHGTTREIKDALREAEEERVGPGPTLLTGGIYISATSIYSALLRLRAAGRVTSKHLTRRTIDWTAVPSDSEPPTTDPRQAVEGA